MDLVLFFKAFVFVFFAALPGRTTFLLIVLGARGRWRAVFLAAACAFAIQCLISIGLGQILAMMAPAFVQLGTGLLFLYFSARYWSESKVHQSDKTAGHKGPSFGSVFFMVFSAEWGDVSQLAIATFSSESPSKVTVFLAALSAMWIITLAAVLSGHYFGKFIAAEKIQKLASFAFFVVGLYFIMQSLRSFMN